MPPIPQTQSLQQLSLQGGEPFPSPLVKRTSHNLEPDSERILVPDSSPAKSDFGDEYHKDEHEWNILPQNVQDTLDQRGLEAYYVAPDGNCLYRALTFGPQWSKHHAARLGTAAYMNGLMQEDNFLTVALDDEKIASVREGILSFGFFFNDKMEVG
jgi:hypothetical protein